jgi:D-alanyl-D-alanine carboxypeptidase
MVQARSTRLVVSLVAVAALAVVAIPASGADTTSTLPPAITTQLDTHVQGVQDLHVPGLVLGVDVPGQGSYVAAAGQSGLDDPQPVAPDSRFRIGSITKTFVATVILQLVGECRLGLDDTLDQWQPSITDASAITIRELLQHTSGIPDYQDTTTFQDQLKSDPFFDWNHQDLVTLIAGQPLLFSPGTQWSYSNSNYLLLGLIAEAVTGRPLEELVRTRIIEPLGLQGTSFPTTAEIPPPSTHGTDVLLDENTLQPLNEHPFDFSPSGVWAAGAMISTMPDLMVWAQALASGALLPPAVQAERLQFVPTGDALPQPTQGPLLPLSYGLGIMAAGSYLGHNGEVTGYEAIMMHDVVSGTTIVEVQDATVSVGKPRHPASDAVVPVADAIVPTVAGILGQSAGPTPTPPAAPPLQCSVPAALPRFTG